MFLPKIHSPDDLKKIPEKNLPALCDEIRKKIIETVAKNGGHLASNLGVVELTIALHRVFSSPRDAIIFDVSHQCYTHKLLTGRYGKFNTLRKEGGISGFTKRNESEHDFFDNGHSSTSISQGLGLLEAWNRTGQTDRKAVVVIGDGALTGGLAFEGLSHTGQLAKNLIIVLNDNQMSISPNTGSISRYLSSLSMTHFYQKFRYTVDNLVEKIPNSKNHIGKLIFRLKRGLKGLVIRENLFVDLGLEYVGPLDGHNIKRLEETFRRVRKIPKPVVVHIMTKKGKGYSPAENEPSIFHGVGPFQISNGVMEKFDAMSFTEAFSRKIVELGEKDKRISCITAAMAKGTGLDAFSRKFPERFYDVGIAEAHAVTFASGLSAGGLVPVVAIYSTFLQRSIDQIIHDVCIPKLHCVFALDRSGAVPGDGETHQGIFDIALLRSIPNLEILCPVSQRDLGLCLDYALQSQSPVALRYPKSACPSELPSFGEAIQRGRGILVKAEEFAPNLSVQFDSEGRTAQKEKKVLYVTTGGLFSEVLKAARANLSALVYTDIYTLRFIKPLDETYFTELAKKYDHIVFVEDGVKLGGVGEYLQTVLASAPRQEEIPSSEVKAFPDKFLSHGTREEILEKAGLSFKNLLAKGGKP
ncbi:MAG: 1-deoxy-D-xylulose-5-phosphate synthase [Treponema sp.]|nr:1-deoxy-D-xylulose-5-phosphate synthase [Treponema sp.]